VSLPICPICAALLIPPPSSPHGSPTATKSTAWYWLASFCSIIGRSTFTLNLHNITSCLKTVESEVSVLEWCCSVTKSIDYFLSPCPYHGRLERLCPLVSNYNVTADQYHRAETCQYAEVSSSFGPHRLFRVRDRPPCSDHKKNVLMMAAHNTNVLHGLTDPQVWNPCVLACAFFISTVFIHRFPPLSIPPSHSVVPHPQSVARRSRECYELCIVNGDQAAGALSRTSPLPWQWASVIIIFCLS